MSNQRSDLGADLTSETVWRPQWPQNPIFPEIMVPGNNLVLETGKLWFHLRFHPNNISSSLANSESEKLQIWLSEPKAPVKGLQRGDESCRLSVNSSKRAGLLWLKLYRHYPGHMWECLGNSFFKLKNIKVRILCILYCDKGSMNKL